MESLTVPAGLPDVGATIAGKYRVERVLGIGGMGVVLAATHLRLDDPVAIKILLPALAGQKEIVERFTREAKAAVRIKSEHVGRVFDVETLDDGTPYMVMEYLEGTDLKALLDRDGPLEPTLAVDYVLQACEALAEAHALGIVHRDLKPSNLYLAKKPDGTTTIKVLDFGIAKVGGALEEGMTKTNVQMGTPFYMAPEQLRSSKDADVRSDIWALGVVLYELLTNKLPFAGESMPELVVAVMLNPAPPVRALRADASAQVEQVISRCLDKDREARFPTIAALVEALAPEGYLDRRGSSARLLRAAPRATSSPSLPELPDVPLAPPPPPIDASSASPPTRAPLPPWLPFAGGGAALVLLVVIVLVVKGGAQPASAGTGEPPGAAPAGETPAATTTPTATRDTRLSPLPSSSAETIASTVRSPASTPTSPSTKLSRPPETATGLPAAKPKPAKREPLPSIH